MFDKILQAGMSCDTASTVKALGTQCKMDSMKKKSCTKTSIVLARKARGFQGDIVQMTEQRTVELTRETLHILVAL
jgi:hypothetical protein